ncbi:hypothetical protein FJZ53_06735 [Candidatus Woesearchaeota archaeon]|nr:hypothetical protein [Candidatus Woesearchaeota archaeon]
MFNCYVVRYSEIALKGDNRNFFEDKLASNIKICLKRNRVLFDKIRNPRGRVIIRTREDCGVLKNVFGITSFSKAVESEQDFEQIRNIALQLYEKGSFKISAQRSDKRFTKSSQQINEELGKFLVEKTGAKVDLKNPDTEIGVEIFDGKAYMFNEKIRGLGGLPIGTAGKVAVLLEDERSIVSAYLMLKRGCSVVFIGKKSFDFSVLDRYCYGSKVGLSEDVPADVKALVVNDMIGSVKNYETDFMVLRPLSSFTREGLNDFLKEIIAEAV